MIYRHYKGGIYYNIGFANRLSNDTLGRRVEQTVMARYTEAKTPEEEKEIAVLTVFDKSIGSKYYAYDTNVIDGVHVLYEGLDGKYWLRPMEMFYGITEEGELRFKKMRGEELFDLISDLTLAWE